ncbi:hypothetical protein SDC9_23074 [bioreactor metagenome]|uniref:Uncharacterized protein n=1 Tax=bioreactor metagenome TaxID=1076179 RepID=A0A644UEB7_9ZZZZ
MEHQPVGLFGRDFGNEIPGRCSSARRRVAVKRRGDALRGIERVAGARKAPETFDLRESGVAGLHRALDQMAFEIPGPEETRFGVGFFPQLAQGKPDTPKPKAGEILEYPACLYRSWKTYENVHRIQGGSFRFGPVGEEYGFVAQLFDAGAAQAPVRAACGDDLALLFPEHPGDVAVARVAPVEGDPQFLLFQVENVHASGSTSAS